MKEYEIRVMDEGDQGFVYNTWMKQTFDTIPYKFMLNEDFRKEHSKVVNRHMRRGTNLVACDVQDPSVIFGYVISEELEDFVCIDFIYVKTAFRGMGICKHLLNSVKVDDKHFVMTQMPKKGSRLERLGPFILHFLFRF